MADSDPVIFDRRSFEIIAKICRREIGRVLNPAIARATPRRGRSEFWWPFKNDATETAPAYGVLALNSDYEHDSDPANHIIHAEKPSVTFTRHYAVNSPEDVDAESSNEALCCPFGDVLVEVLYDSATGTPAYGEGWGPKPGQWSIAKGFPGYMIVGIVDSTNHLALAVSECPIGTLLGKTTGAITGGTASTSWRVYSGTLDAETDAGFTTVPSALSMTDIDSGLWIKLTWLSSGWRMEPLECNA